MSDPVTDLTLRMDRLLIASTRPGLFTMTVDHAIRKENAERIHAQWRFVWERMQLTAPPLLILEAGMHLTAVSDAALLDLGFVRIPMEATDETRDEGSGRQLVPAGNGQEASQAGLS